MQHLEQDHRRHYRHRKSAVAWLDFHDSPGTRDATIVDLSPEGGCFRAAARVRPRAPVLLRFTLDSQSPPIEAKGRVCWSAPRPDGTHDFGIRFLDLTEDEIARLGSFLAE